MYRRRSLSRATPLLRRTNPQPTSPTSPFPSPSSRSSSWSSWTRPAFSSPPRPAHVVQPSPRTTTAMEPTWRRLPRREKSFAQRGRELEHEREDVPLTPGCTSAAGSFPPFGRLGAVREQRSGVSFAGPAVHPNPKLEKIWGKARRGRGVHMELSSFPAYHEQRRGGQQGGRRGLRARGGRARAATWRSSVPGEGGNNKFVNVEVCKHTELS